LYKLKQNADINGVPLYFLSRNEIERGEPHLKVIFSSFENVQYRTENHISTFMHTHTRLYKILIYSLFIYGIYPGSRSVRVT
jgi:hypothetical protein